MWCWGILTTSKQNTIPSTFTEQQMPFKGQYHFPKILGQPESPPVGNCKSHTTHGITSPVGDTPVLVRGYPIPVLAGGTPVLSWPGGTLSWGTPQKWHGTRDWVPLERTWDQRPRKEPGTGAPTVLTDTHLWKLRSRAVQSQSWPLKWF